MLEPYDGKLSRTVLRRERGSNPSDLVDFSKLVKALGGKVIEIHNASDIHFNPFDINMAYGGEDDPSPIPFKSDFIISLIEVTLGYKNGLDPISKSVIDRCVRLVYKDWLVNPIDENIPTFKDFFNILNSQPEVEANQLAVGLEIYIEGSLNIFASKTNFEINNRLICFNTQRLGKQLQTMAMTIIQDYCWNLISKNRNDKKNTWLWNDEVHLSFKNNTTADWLVSSWKRGRKYGLLATGMTQEIQDVLRHLEARALITNSEFVILYRQKSSQIDDLSQVIDLSEEQVNTLLSCDSGTGLFKAGNSIVEFNNIYPKGTALFKLMETDINKTSEQSSVR